MLELAAEVDLYKINWPNDLICSNLWKQNVSYQVQ